MNIDFKREICLKDTEYFPDWPTKVIPETVITAKEYSYFNIASDLLAAISGRFSIRILQAKVWNADREVWGLNCSDHGFQHGRLRIAFG